MKKLPTGEPYAGKPHVRFGGRGGRKAFSTPITVEATAAAVWSLTATAGASASVMLPCQEGESPSDVKS